jgi:hypothetical protein
VGTRCAISVQQPGEDPSEGKKWISLTEIYPEDVNRTQEFDLKPSLEHADGGIEAIKLNFEESSDFFGRITVYHLDIQGSFVESC